MKLRKRKRRTLQIIFTVLLIFMMLMPVCINFIPQKSTGIDPRLLAEMQAAQEETDKNIEGTYQITDFVNGNCFTILYGQEQKDVKLIAYAYRADGTFINQELLAMGLAEMKEEKENTMYAEELRMAQEAAKGKGLGRWAKE